MRLAIFPSSGLGDGIIQLVLAQNLAKLGIDVDYYHQLLADIDTIVDGVNVLKPTDTLLKMNLEKYDLLLLDRGSKEADLSIYYQSIKSRLAFYTMSRNKRKWFGQDKEIPKNPEFLAPTLSIKGHQVNLGVFNGRSLRAEKYSGLSTAGGIVQFLKKYHLVDDPDYQLRLSIPEDWKRQEHKNRILVHPTSTSEKKNWLPNRYISLAEKLKNIGYCPVFTVAPVEAGVWQSQINGRFDIPVFHNILDISRYYFESALLIGTDSGNGHLASAFSLPTVTIVNRYSRPFPWRPNWSYNQIIRPLVSRNLAGDHYWKYTVSENRILKVVGNILS